MFAAILICGTSVFTSCDDEKEDKIPDLNIAGQITGRWINAEMDGLPVQTNQKLVINFLSATKALVSASFNDDREGGDGWHNLVESDVVIDGNKVTMTNANDKYAKVVCEFTLTAINDKEFTGIQKMTVIANDVLQDALELPVRYVKVTDDFSAAILGMWEGHSTGAEGSEFDDGENHRWEYLLDGTFRYYRKVNGMWQLSDDEYSKYFVAGNLLCTRWKNAGDRQEEHREWWEIESIKDGVMKWKALRQKDDGSTYTATFEMREVYVPTEAEVKQNILGKWMTTEIGEQEVPTNDKCVYDFESFSTVYMSASNNSRTDFPAIWNDKIEFSAGIFENHIVLARMMDEHTLSLDELIVASISETHMDCVLRHSIISETEDPIYAPDIFCSFEKVDDDFSEAVLGTWEGQVTSDQDTFGDGLLHRWEYKADGTYVYYVKDGDRWKPSTNTLNEYFVAGKLLCSRWINDGKELREWWEIESIKDGVMKWRALRQKEDGSTFTSTFEMRKVTE